METINQFEDEQWLGKAAIVGLSCRFPGAEDVHRYWSNLLDGVESVERFEATERARSRFAPGDMDRDAFVGAEAVMPGVDEFDHELFGYTPGEARRLDPQLRIALQCAHEALEDAGCGGMAPHEGKVGVFFSASMSTYLLEHVLEENMDGLGALLGNDKDHIATTIAFRLGLTGAAVSVGSGCSSSAAALHFACLALATYQCDVALVGGSSIIFPQRQGHVYREGGVYSQDGHCRPFSADATGTIGGSGVGVVVLRRLDEAVRDNHSIYCAIAGSACGNDGRRKVGYAAPSVEGQVETIRLALATAQADPKDFAYIEAHATGTALGDPIELDALHRAFGPSGGDGAYCALGSVKANIGHLDSASGVASVIKAALCVSERKRPPQIGFTQGHPLVPWQTSPFRVESQGGSLFEGAGTGYVGVNSLGMGGTNVFVVLEPAPQRMRLQSQGNQPVPILLSAHRTDVLEDVISALHAYVLAESPDLTDLAYTLCVGRKPYACRVAFLCRDLDELLAQLEQGLAASLAIDEADSMISAWLANEPVDLRDRFPVTALRLHLPAYPYRRTLCRMEARAALSVPVWRRALMAVPEAPSREQDRTVHAALEDYCIALVRDFLADRAIDLSARQPLERVQVLEQFGLAPAYARFGEYLIDVLLSRSLFTPEQTALRPTGLTDLPHSSQLAASICERWPVYTPLVKLLAELARQRESIVCQGRPVLEVLANQSHDAIAAAIACDAQRSAVLADQFNQIDSFLRQFAAQLDRPLRVLEIGCGHIALTEHLLVATGSEHIMEYWVTDADERLVAKARERLEGTVTSTSSHLHFARFDIDRRPATQGLPIGHFDALIGFNVLHVAADLHVALDNLGDVINEQGVMCQIDTVDPRLSTQLIWGMLPEWWRYEDQRVHGPLLSIEAYRHLLASACSEHALVGRLDEKAESLLWFATPKSRSTEHTYVPAWRRVTGLCPQPWRAGEVVLAFVDDAMLRAGIDSLAGENAVTVMGIVRAGLDPVYPDDRAAVPGAEADVRAAIQACLHRHGKIDRVVYAWDAPVLGCEQGDALVTSLGTLHWAAKALDQLQGEAAVEWLLISRGLYRVAGDERVQAQASLAQDMMRMIELEYPQFHLRHVELPLQGRLPQQFVAACTAAHDGDTLAIRGRHLWQPYHERVDLPGTEPDLNGAVVVLVGGLGGLGLSIAQALVSRFELHLVIVHRANWLDLPATEDNEKQALIRQQLATIQGRAMSLQLEHADANERDAVFAAARSIGERHGNVDGVLYLAGEVDRQGVLRNRSFAALEQSVRTKTHGVSHVTEAFAGLAPRFHVNFSSIGTVLHKAKFGEAGYVIGNGYLNAHAREGGDAACRFMCINWTDWQADGMWAYAQLEFQARYALNTDRRDSESDTWGDSHWLQSLSARQGVDLLLRALASEHDEIVVCAQDLQTLMDYQKRATHADYGRYLDTLQLSAAVQSPRQTQVPSFAVQGTPRVLAQIWEELLGVCVQSMEDNFYTAGGDSLLALRLAALVKQAYGVDLSLSTLLDTLTFGGFVAYIDRKLAEKPSASEVSIGL